MSAEEVDRTLASLTLSEDDGVAAVNGKSFNLQFQLTRLKIWGRKL